MSTTKSSLVIVGLMFVGVSGLGTFMHLQHLKAADQQTNAEKREQQAALPGDDVLKAKRQEVLAAARGGFEQAFANYMNARLNNVEEVCNWSVRWCETERAVNLAIPEQLVALEAHLERLKKIEEITLARKGVNRLEITTSQFHRIQAEQRILELRQG